MPGAVHTSTSTVEPPITDPPNSGPPPNNGQTRIAVDTQYIFCSLIAGNLRISNKRTSAWYNNYTDDTSVTEKWAGHVRPRVRAFSFVSGYYVTYAVGFWQ